MSIVWQRIKPRPAEFHGRVSCDAKDAGYANWCLLGGYTGKITVTLDGVEQRNAVIADPDKGFVYRAKTKFGGGVVISGDEIVMETVKGHVQVLVGE